MPWCTDKACCLQLVSNLGEVSGERDDLQACRASLEAQVRQLQAELRSWQGRCSTSEEACSKLEGDLEAARAANTQLKVHLPAPAYLTLHFCDGWELNFWYRDIPSAQVMRCCSMPSGPVLQSYP